jgi:hypothetical protein
METFPASDETQWQLIKRVIQECDYYIVIVGGRYGSIGPSGLSYTEMEYDYAVESGLPVLGFVKDAIDDLPAKDVDKEAKIVDKLNSFREKVMSRSCRKYKDSPSLGMLVMKSLVQESRNNPQTGWVKASAARTEDDLNRETHLRTEIQSLEQIVEDLERQLRDRQIGNRDNIPLLLPKLTDELRLSINFKDKSKNTYKKNVFTYDEIFGVIGSSMYGYIIKKSQPGYNSRGTYSFEDDLCEYVRRKEPSFFGAKVLSLTSDEVAALMIVYKELGLIMYQIKKGDGEADFRGFTLTAAGEEQLVKANLNRLS